MVTVQASGEPRNPTIVWYSACPWLGTGYGKVTRYVVSGLRRLGLDVHVVCPNVVGNLEWLGVPIHGKAADGQAPYDPSLPTMYYRLLRARLLISLFDVWAIAGLSSIPDIVWVPWVPVDAPLDEHVLEIVAPLHSSNIARIVAMSRFGLEQLCRVLPSRKGDIVHIPHGVDTSLYRPVPPEEKPRLRKMMGLPEEGFFLLCVATNIGDRKDIPGLLKAFKIFLDNVRDRDVHLLLWTNRSPSPGTSYDIVRLVKRLGIEENVHLPDVDPPWVYYPEEMMVLVYNVADWLVTASAGEGFCLPVLEAFACGVPVIANANSALVEHLDDTTTLPEATVKVAKRGILVKPSIVRVQLWTVTHQEYSYALPEHVAEAMELAYNMGVPRSMTRNCLEYARMHDWSRIVTMWRELIRDVAGI